MQKLLFITTNLNDSGGVSRILSVKLNYLVKTFGYKICILNTAGNLDSMFYHFDEKIEMFSLGKNKTNQINIFSYKKTLNNVINNINPDVIVNCDNGLKGSILPYLISSSTPIIYERHCSKNLKIKHWIDRFKFKTGNLILSLSKSKYSVFVVLNNEESKEWKFNNIKVIPNPLWYKLPTNLSNFSNNIAIAVGRQAFEKGYDLLLYIWKIVIKSYPNWVLKIYGEKNENLKLEAIAENLKISNNIKFYQSVKNIKDVYLNASLLLNTSRSEAFGLSLIEGMSFGLPVVAFENTNGIKSIINNNENGILIEKNNLKLFAKKIIDLIENQSDMKRISENGRKSLLRFDLDKIMNQWHDLFQLINSFHSTQNSNFIKIKE